MDEWITTYDFKTNHKNIDKQIIGKLCLSLYEGRQEDTILNSKSISTDSFVYFFNKRGKK